jgi:hypothetical protein
MAAALKLEGGRGTDRTRSSAASASYLNGTGIGGLRETLDEREVLV